MASTATCLRVSGTSKSGWPMLRLMGFSIDWARSKTLRMPEAETSVERWEIIVIILSMPGRFCTGSLRVFSPTSKQNTRGKATFLCRFGAIKDGNRSFAEYGSPFVRHRALRYLKMRGWIQSKIKAPSTLRGQLVRNRRSPGLLPPFEPILFLPWRSRAGYPGFSAGWSHPCR